jgi:hypothetical protein
MPRPAWRANNPARDNPEPDRSGTIPGLSLSGFHDVAYVDWGPSDVRVPVVCVMGSAARGTTSTTSRRIWRRCARRHLAVRAALVAAHLAATHQWRAAIRPRPYAFDALSPASRRLPRRLTSPPLVGLRRQLAAARERTITFDFERQTGPALCQVGQGLLVLRQACLARQLGTLFCMLTTCLRVERHGNPLPVPPARSNEKRRAR